MLNNNLNRLPGLKFMRTVWVCDVAGGPPAICSHKTRCYSSRLEEAHRELRISPAEFDEVAAEAHKDEITQGYAR
jgi:hemoglobin